jgi:hypothetical protein
MIPKKSWTIKAIFVQFIDKPPAQFSKIIISYYLPATVGINKILVKSKI